MTTWPRARSGWSLSSAPATATSWGHSTRSVSAVMKGNELGDRPQFVATIGWGVYVFARRGKLEPAAVLAGALVDGPLAELARFPEWRRRTTIPRSPAWRADRDGCLPGGHGTWRGHVVRGDRRLHADGDRRGPRQTTELTSPSQSLRTPRPGTLTVAE